MTVAPVYETMKLYIIAIAVAATAGSLVAASPSPHRHHQHKHAAEKRSPSHVKVVNVPGPTVMAYELNGKIVSQSEVCDGIKSGKLKWANDGNVPDVCSSQTAVQASTLAPEPASTSSTSSVVVAQNANFQKPTTTSEQAYTTPAAVSTPESSSTSSSTSVAPSTSSPAAYTPSSSSSSSSSSSNDGSSGGQGLDTPFPDDEIDCSDFPSDYGAIEIPWMGIGGWAGIQYVTIEGGQVTNIDTAVAGGKNCTAGAMCSYACPPGYQKSQWPSTQGSTGQSVGGLKCNENGKLAKTNPELSETLCIKGTGATTVQNTMSQNAAICRTDYPGMSAYLLSNIDCTDLTELCRH